MSVLTLPPLSLYIHIPWCVQKCPYCDFNSHKAQKELPEAEYVLALCADMEEEKAAASGRPLHSIFIGGGTPSLFSDRAIGGILKHAERIFGFVEDIEITLEANPGTFEQARFEGFAREGVNRLSIGIQSFQDAQLQALGRIHDAGEALRAVNMARSAGFDNINLDLMHGLPQQSLEQAMADLQQAMDFEPEHISWYQLTIEQNTEFYSSPPQLPVEDVLADIQDAGQAKLANQGFQQYEVSAYARQNKRSRHNLNYWQFGDYIGVGAGAHGKVTLPDSPYPVRRKKTRLPKHYLAAASKPQDFCAGESLVEPSKLKLEFLMNALRLNEGAPIALFEQRTGLQSGDLEPQWQALKDKGLLMPSSTQIQASPLGLRFLNSVLEGFLD